jgi:hypothetical protein
VDRHHRGNLPEASVIGQPSPGLILLSWPTGHTEARRVIPRPAPKRRPSQRDPPEVDVRRPQPSVQQRHSETLGLG